MTLAQWIVLTSVISSVVWIIVLCVVLVRVRYYRQVMRCWYCGRFFERVSKKHLPLNHTYPEPGLCLHCLNNQEQHKEPVHNGADNMFGFPLE